MTRDHVPSSGTSPSAADRLPGGTGSHRAGTGRGTSLRRGDLLTLAAMCLGVMMTFLLVTATISALSAIQADLHVGPGALIWIPSAYTLVVAALVLSAGTLGNLLGRKRMFCVGVVIMIAGGVLAATADTTATVIAAQLVSGVGGALVLPNSLAVLGAAFADPQRRTEVITVWAASSGIGLAIGPLLAGVLLDRFSWHAVFVSNPVLGVITLLVAVPFAAESLAPDGRLDVVGALLGTLTIASLVYALIQGGQDGYTAGPVIAAWVAAAVGAVVFVAVELRVAAPMLDVRLFASRSFSAVMLIAAVSLFGFTGVAVLVVMFYNNVQHLSALDTSWRMLPLFGVYVVSAFLTGRVIRRTGFKAPLTVGLLLGALAVLGLTTVGADTPYSRVWPLFALFGAASGLVIAPSTAAALVSVTPERAGMASGAVNTARQVGAVMGTALLGSLLAGRVTADLPQQLAEHGIPASARAPVEQAVASGTTSTTAPPGDAVRAAIADAFTSGVHTGLAVTAAVFLAAAVVALTAVHNRPHQNGTHMPAPTTAPTTS
ncbi:MFS transporter [Streptomyces sp. CA-210063]|uniref:MFS transporter n=1 Tax=Streptomyces sp. CA-210063 TaxID=2801029 RepID=UPI00214C2632|nr:MFS transporter [Streptomyces sp. CA-210063]UUU34120.1 MFS transporter [Streptomyces sp. CA-210063]